MEDPFSTNDEKNLEEELKKAKKKNIIWSIVSLILVAVLVGGALVLYYFSPNMSTTTTYQCGYTSSNGSVSVVTVVEKDSLKIDSETYTYTYNDYAYYGYDSIDEMKEQIDLVFGYVNLENFNYSSKLDDDGITYKYTLDYNANEDKFQEIAEAFYGYTEEEIGDYTFFTFAMDDVDECTIISE